MKLGSKYYPLFEYLRDSKEREVTLTFAEVEAIMDNLLPESARNKKNWWSNRDSSSALQAGAWIYAGYQVKIVDMNAQVVTFHEFQTEYTIQKVEGEILWQRDAIKALRKHMKLTQAQFAERMGVRRQTVSEWESGVYNPDRSTAKHLELLAKTDGFAE